jgi:hypothetical protein
MGTTASNEMGFSRSFKLSMQDRSELVDVLNGIQTTNRVQITKLDVDHVNEDLYVLRSARGVPCDNPVPCTGISSSEYNDIRQVHVCSHWYANFHLKK